MGKKREKERGEREREREGEREREKFLDILPPTDKLKSGEEADAKMTKLKCERKM